MFRKASTVPPDTPEQDPAVEQAAAKVAELTGILAEAEVTVTAVEEVYAKMQVAAADFLTRNEPPPPLGEYREAISVASEKAYLLSLALSKAKEHHGAVLQEAKARHWAMLWRFYQDKIRVFDTALSAAFEAQEEARLAWVAAGQPGEVPLLKAPLANWQPYFHTFLQDILDMPATSVRRGSTFSLESGPGLPARSS